MPAPVDPGRRPFRDYLVERARDLAADRTRHLPFAFLLRLTPEQVAALTRPCPMEL